MLDNPSGFVLFISLLISVFFNLRDVVLYKKIDHRNVHGMIFDRRMGRFDLGYCTSSVS